MHLIQIWAPIDRQKQTELKNNNSLLVFLEGEGFFLSLDSTFVIQSLLFFSSQFRVHGDAEGFKVPQVRHTLIAHSRIVVLIIWVGVGHS